MSNKFLTLDQETIIALSTPKGSGAIAVIRLSGDDSFEIVDKVSRLSANKKIINCETHTIEHGFIVNNKTNSIIDEVLFFIMRAPRTFTGQNTIEISCHNNSFIIENIINESILAGARLAKLGEFTQRAFLNGKIDLVQAESINDLIHAQTELAVKKSMLQVKGSLSNFILEIEESLLYILALTEGSFEFFEQEVQDLDINNLIKNNINNLLEKLNNLKNNFNVQQQIKNGIKISLIGLVNAGKSTLFNSILGHDRAIVTQVAGTTRDVIESSLYKNGNFWQLTDTAGLRETNDVIEKEGITRSLEQAEISDIILLVVDSSCKLTKEQIKIYKQIIDKYKQKIIFVANKFDIKDSTEILNYLKTVFDVNFLPVSGKNKFGVNLLEIEIENIIQKNFAELRSPFLLNKRQLNLIIELIDGIKFIENNLLKNFEYEIVAHHVKSLLESVLELTGKNVNEKMLDKIFKDFCIGK
ncbi:MAG: tRNA modification GTPase MnmE [candidate division TM6 bacterium GW2011_GWF2_28_16]|nr:MAG: tRNA modification GTPase MnmE [candidate division TM6 bacterium GW2011_GWF2_28_16]